jgi:hypothetical protein
MSLGVVKPHSHVATKRGSAPPSFFLLFIFF